MPPLDPHEVARLSVQETELSILPTIVTYSRLEPLSLSSGDLTPGLQMLLGDPLWLLGRQWQFEELRGEDGGSPVLAQMRAETGPITRFHAGRVGDDAQAATTSVDAPGPQLPLEVAVEAEETPLLPERMRAELGLQLQRRLGRAKLPAAVRRAVAAAMVST